MGQRPRSKLPPLPVPPRPRGRRPGIEVDPAAVRRARVDAGLTLAQVAGPELSRQAIQRIEAGLARPSMRTLEIIAERIGSPVSALLAPRRPRPPITGDPAGELEKLCRTHQYEPAVAYATAILELEPEGQLEAQVRHHLGLALVRLNRAAEALEHLVAARTLFESLDDAWLVAETTDWEACALYLLRDPRALDVVRRALSWYRALEPRSADTESRMLEHVGMILLWHHEWDQVIAYFEEALRMPGVIRDFARMGRIYHGLGVAHDHLGNHERASEVLRNALVLYRQEHELTTGAAQAWLARAENELGLVLAHMREFGRADYLIRSSMDRAAQAGLRREESHFLLSLGELRALERRDAEAFEALRRGIEVGTEVDELTSVGAGYAQMAELHARAGEDEQADHCFALAAGAFQRSGYVRRLEECRSAWAAVRAARTARAAEA